MAHQALHMFADPLQAVSSRTWANPRSSDPAKQLVFIAGLVSVLGPVLGDGLEWLRALGLGRWTVTGGFLNRYPEGAMSASIARDPSV